MYLQPNPVTPPAFPSRGIWWPRVLILWVCLTFGQPLVRCTPIPYTPIAPVEASSGQEWYYFGSAWHLVSDWVRLTFGQMYPLCPLVEAYTGQELYYFESPWHLVSLWVSLTFEMYPLHPSSHHPQVEASSGQEWYYFESAWHLVSLWSDVPPYTPSPPMPLPPVEASSCQEWYYLGSAWHLVSLWSLVPLCLWVRLTFDQMYTLHSHLITPVEASSGQEWSYFGSAWHLISLWVRLIFGQVYALLPHLSPHHPQ